MAWRSNRRRGTVLLTTFLQRFTVKDTVTMSQTRRIKLSEKDTPDSLSERGGGNKHELYLANKKWMTGHCEPWNPGQEMDIPLHWKPLEGEYLST